MSTYQSTVLHDINKDYQGYNVKVMHNEEDGAALATQVQDLTDGEMHFGQFRMESSCLVNDEKKIAIVLPEKILEERDLFNKVKNEMEFVSDKIDFIIKKSESDIHYGVRENNMKGIVELNGKKFKVFEEQPSAYGDATRALLVQQKQEKLKVSKKQSLGRKNRNGLN